MHPEILDAEVGDESFLDAILKPHLRYYKPLKDLFGVDALHGMAHIIGGGIEGNLCRIIPENLNAAIDLSRIDVLPLFKKIYVAGNVDERDMLRTFNLGVGLILVVDVRSVESIIEHLAGHGMKGYRFGEIVDGNKQVVFRKKLIWE